MTTTFIAKLEVRDRGSYLSAICAQVPGLHLVDGTREGLRRRAMQAIPMLLRANRQLAVVSVQPTDDLTELRVTTRA